MNSVHLTLLINKLHHRDSLIHIRNKLLIACELLHFENNLKSNRFNADESN